MPIRRMRLTHAACALLVALVTGAAWAGVDSPPPPARAASIGQLQQRIGAGRGHITALSGAVSAASRRMAQLSANIAALTRHLGRVQADLAAKRAELVRIHDQLVAARLRLSQLEAYEASAEQVLARQLVASYESDHPDVVTVVLNATGFRDLLERLAFMQRVRKQDINIISQVRAARRAVAAEATRLGKLEVRQQVITAQVLTERNSLARTNASLMRQRAEVARFRASKAGQLASARAEVSRLQDQLSQLLAAQAAAAARAAEAARAARAASQSS
ncbi:MAG: hypothetical protein JOZ95_15795, partial [Solirubrobacterales bacterium]|nr:hypothetical protein [Solirubrobacterales bacterium]